MLSDVRTQSLCHHKPIEFGETFLVTRQAAKLLGVGISIERLRRAATPIACDVASRAVLYNLRELEQRFPSRVA